MISVSIHEAKTNLSSLIRAVEQRGEKVVILRHGTPVAELVPVARGSRTKLHSAVKDIQVLYDPLAPTQEEWDDV
mgnify:CR=1 FL=1|jgi:prevent-host-death family protein